MPEILAFPIAMWFATPQYKTPQHRKVIEKTVRQVMLIAFSVGLFIIVFRL